MGLRFVDCIMLPASAHCYTDVSPLRFRVKLWFSIVPAEPCGQEDMSIFIFIVVVLRWIADRIFFNFNFHVHSTHPKNRTFQIPCRYLLLSGKGNLLKRPREGYSLQHFHIFINRMERSWAAQSLAHRRMKIHRGKVELRNTFWLVSWGHGS